MRTERTARLRARRGSAAGSRRPGRLLAAALACASTASAALLTGAAPASADVFNVTIHIPADVRENPCVPGDWLNLHGDLHILMSSTTNRAGGASISYHSRQELRGSSILTGATYVGSERTQRAWRAGPTFPDVQLESVETRLVGQGKGTADVAVRVRARITTYADGTVETDLDHVSTTCRG